MARLSSQAPWSFAELLRQHLRSGGPMDCAEAVELLHAHFGDRIGAAFGRAAQIERLATGAAGVKLSEKAQRLMSRAASVRELYLPENSLRGSELRRADLFLGAGAGLASVLRLAGNARRPVALLVRGLRPDDAAVWLRTNTQIDVAIFLGSEDGELRDHLELVAEIQPSRPTLWIVPSGELRPEGCRWFHAAPGESLSGMLEEAMDACTRLMGAEQLTARDLTIRAVFTGGLALARALDLEPDLTPSRIEVQDALYGALPWQIEGLARRNPSLELSLDVLPHQAKNAQWLSGLLPSGRVKLEFSRPPSRL